MKVVIKENYHDLSEFAAEMIANLVRSKPDCVLGLATGETPIGTYKRLIKYHNEGLDFSRVRTFNLDEYLGVGMDLSKSYSEDQSYARFMYEELFRHINIRKENVHIPDGLTKDTKAYCSFYEDKIKELGGIDLQILGIGCNGHWAFNEPGSPFDSRTRVIALDKQTLDNNYEVFYKDSGISRSEMPHSAITMGIGTILESKSVLMLAHGSKKAEIVAKSLEGPVTTDVTASSIQLFKGNATVVLDRAASAKLLNIHQHQHI